MVQGRIVIVGYKPFKGKEEALEELLRQHVDILRQAGLATDRAPILMKAADGTLLEIFEWKSKDAIDHAHSHPGVQHLWKEFAEVCEYVPVGDLPEAAHLFSEFASL